MCLHGTGGEFHEEPDVLHYGRKGTGMLLVPGMVFTIEPMINMGTCEVFIDEELEKISGGYLPIPDMPGWRGQSTPWWWSLIQSNFSDAYSSFYNATH